MSAVSILPAEADGHVETALPWYVNGTLSEAERAQVESHLSQCAQCRASQHLEFLLQGQVRGSADSLEQTERDGWDMLSRKLDLTSASVSAPAAAGAMAMGAGGRARSRARSRFASGLVLAQAATIAALAVALIIALSDRQAPRYKTLTDTQQQIEASTPTLRVVFADEATSASMRRLLAEIRGTISAGPGASNVYTVRLLQAPGGPAQSSDEAAKWLRSQPGVLFAEAVDSHPD